MQISAKEELFQVLQLIEIKIVVHLAKHAEELLQDKTKNKQRQRECRKKIVV